MPVYVWKGKNSYGEKRKGELEAPDQTAALAQVKRLRITNAVVKEKPKDLFANIALFKPKVTGKDIVVFTRQLSTMINAGLPLVQGIEILEKQQSNPTFKGALGEIRQDVEAGSTLADSMRKKPKIFDNLFTNMIEAGETGGILDTILGRLATFMEKSMTLKKKVKGAMTYPTICLAISILILVIILVFVVPVFSKMFEDFGSSLPMPTQVVVNISNLFKSYFLYIVIAFFVMVMIFKKIYATEKGRLTIDRGLLRAPVVGVLLRKVAVAKFTRTLSTMLQSGVPILEALQVVGKNSRQ